MTTILVLLLKFRYVILVPLAAFEGPVVSLVAGFLVYSGVFNFWIAYAILLVGDIIPDTFFYILGYWGSEWSYVKKLLQKSDLIKNHIDTVKKLWTYHPFKTMFFGKLAYGMALPFLVSAGVVKMPYKKFILHAIPISLFQYGVIMSIGYYLGNSYAKASAYVNLAYGLLAALVLLCILVYILIAKYARKKMISMEHE